MTANVFWSRSTCRKALQLAAVCRKVWRRQSQSLDVWLNVVNLNVARLESRVYKRSCAEERAGAGREAGGTLFPADSPSVPHQCARGPAGRGNSAEADADVELIIMASPKPACWKRLLRPGHG